MNKVGGGLSVIVLVLGLVLFSRPQLTNGGQIDQQSTSHTPGVRLSVLSQHFHTPDEQATDVLGLDVAVRVRLSNDTTKRVCYLAGFMSIAPPAGYTFRRKTGEAQWTYYPKTRGREGPPGSEFIREGNVWYCLPPGSAVEYEQDTWHGNGEEQAFSLFIKTSSDAKPVELVSDVFRPLSKRL